MIYGAGLSTIGLTPVILFGAVVLVVVGFTCAHWLRRPHPSAV